LPAPKRSPTKFMPSMSGPSMIEMAAGRPAAHPYTSASMKAACTVIRE